jgi:hypothetical protein
MDSKFFGSALVLVISACASAQSPAPTATVQDSLKPSASESVAMVVAAKGVQIYECRTAKNQADAYEWAFVAPEAELFDSSGKRIGTHYAGPQWEATDGSKIVGTVKARADAPQLDAIPWLLLTAKSVGAQGALSKITSVQRVNTVGGAAPQGGCSQSAVGTVVRVPYTADYYFLTEKFEGPSQPNAAASPAVERIGVYD